MNFESPLSIKVGAQKYWTPISFAIAFIFFLLIFDYEHLGLFGISGDSICHYAYWIIAAKRPDLAGTISAAQTKPDQTLLMGLILELYPFVGLWGMKLIFSSLAAALTATISRISLALGGLTTAIISLALAMEENAIPFLTADSQLGFLLCIFAGILLFFYKTSKTANVLGLILIVTSIHFRIEGIGILGIAGLLLLWQREYKKLTFLSFGTAFSIVVWALIMNEIQGSISPTAGGGAGYVTYSEARSSGWFLAGIRYLTRTFFGMFVDEPSLIFKYSLSTLAFVWVASRRPIIQFDRVDSRIFLTIGAAGVVLMLNVLIFGGSIQNRYFGFFKLFGMAFGPAAVFSLFSAQRRTLSFLLILFLLHLPVWRFLRGIVKGEWRAQITYQPYSSDAFYLVENNIIPKKSRIMTEDDILYVLLTLNPYHFQGMHALQHFNVLNEQDRIKTLGDTDFIYISKGAFFVYYLRYLIVPSWKDDPFRKMVHDLLDGGRSAQMYGYNFFSEANDERGLLIRVAKAL